MNKDSRIIRAIEQCAHTFVTCDLGYIFPLVLFSFSPGTFKDQFSAGTFFLPWYFVDTVVLYLLHGTCTFLPWYFFFA